MVVITSEKLSEFWTSVLRHSQEYHESLLPSHHLAVQQKTLSSSPFSGLRVSKPNAMQVAAFLSDLKSLSVCNHEAAVKLVSLHKKVADDNELHNIEQRNIQANEDMKRADELVSLHESVKIKHLERGFDPELLQARKDVSKILESLNRD